jgi:large subunit ribosomal protein L3
MAGIIGRKVGMTQIFAEDGERIPVTVIEAGPCHVTAVRDSDDAPPAIQLAFGETKEQRLTKATLGHLKKAGAPASKHLAEFKLSGSDESELKIGDQVTVEAFETGQRVKVSGTSKGKGFQGTIKRHGFHRGPVSHGSHNVRAPGSIGASATPSRVLRGKRMPGQTGNERITQRGLEVVEIDSENNLLLLRGAVPGPSGAVVEVRSQ